MTSTLWILTQIVSPVFALMYGLALSTWRYPKSKTITLASLLILALTAVNFVAIQKMYPVIDKFPAFDFIYRIANIIVIVAIAVLLIKQSSAKKARIAFGGFSVCLCVLVVDTFAVSIRSYWGHFPLELLCELLLYPLMLAVVIKIRIPFMEVTRYMDKRLWPLSFVPITLIIAILLQISTPIPLEFAQENIPVALMLCCIAIATYGTIFYLFKTINIQSNLEQNIAVMKIYASSLERQKNISAQNEKTASLYRHDLRHITKMLLAYLDKGDVKSACELIQDYDKKVVTSWTEPFFRYFTGHKLIDATMSHYLDFAKNLGIEMMVTVGRMDDISVDKTELAVVLANALENAVCACEKMPEHMSRVIRVQGSQRGKQYLFEIANTCAENVEFSNDTGLPLSETYGHGLGSQSIAFFAKKNKAVLDYCQTGEWFNLRLLMS